MLSLEYPGDSRTLTIIIEIGKMMKRGIALVQSPVFHPENSFFKFSDLSDYLGLPEGIFIFLTDFLKLEFSSLKG